MYYFNSKSEKNKWKKNADRLPIIAHTIYEGLLIGPVVSVYYVVDYIKFTFILPLGGSLTAEVSTSGQFSIIGV